MRQDVDADAAELRVAQSAAQLGNRLGGSLFFVPSPLEGWGLRALIEALGPGSVVVLAEKDDDLAPWSRASVADLALASDRVFWLRADDEEAVRELFSSLRLGRLRRCVWFPVAGGWLLHATRYREVFARLEREVATFWSNRLTSLHLGPLWIRNVFDNLAGAEFRPTPWPDWGDDPVVVCGAGPSLEDWLPALRAHRGSFRLLVADTALPIVLDGGLEPDAVVCLESQQANLRDFLPAAGKPLPLFLDLSAHPATTRALSGPVYWFCTEFAGLHLWRRLPAVLPRVPALGSVGVTAVAVALRLTAGRVVLGGLDFSWPTGKSHARGAPSLARALETTQRLRSVEQVPSFAGVRSVGRDLWTTGILEGYARSLAELAGRTGRVVRLGARGLTADLEVATTWPLGPATLGPLVAPSPLPRPAVLAAEVAEVRALLADLAEANTDLASMWPRLQSRLERLDWLHFAFPDPEIRADSSFLSRVLVLARWWLDRLERRLADGSS